MPSGETLYYLAFVAFSVVGMFTYGYAYCFHLVHVQVISPTLQESFRAITKNGSKILGLFSFAFTMIYIFSVIMWAYFRAEMDPENAQYCDSLVECYFPTFSEGLLFGGAFRESMMGRDRTGSTGYD